MSEKQPQTSDGAKPMLSDERWRDTYDQWKTGDPHDGEPEPQDFDASGIEPPCPEEYCAFRLRMIVERLQFRIDAMRDKGLSGVSISLGFASEIATTCRAASEMLEPPVVGL